MEQLEYNSFKLEFSWVDITDMGNIDLYPIGAKEYLVQGFKAVIHFIYKQ